MVAKAWSIWLTWAIIWPEWKLCWDIAILFMCLEQKQFYSYTFAESKFWFSIRKFWYFLEKLKHFTTAFCPLMMVLSVLHSLTLFLRTDINDNIKVRSCDFEKMLNSVISGAIVTTVGQLEKVLTFRLIRQTSMTPTSTVIQSRFKSRLFGLHDFFAFFRN